MRGGYFRVIYRNSKTGKPVSTAPLPPAQAREYADELRRRGKAAKLVYVSEAEYDRSHNISPHRPGGRRS